MVKYNHRSGEIPIQKGGQRIMNKGEFLRAVAEKAGVTIKDATAVYEAFVEVVEEAMKKNEKVTLVGFGTFEAKQRPERTCNNPANGQKVKVEACKVPALKFGKSFKAKIN